MHEGELPRAEGRVAIVGAGFSGLGMGSVAFPAVVLGERVERARQAFYCDLIGKRGVRLIHRGAEARPRVGGACFETGGVPTRYAHSLIARTPLGILLIYLPRINS
jgi:hypothetical protein